MKKFTFNFNTFNFLILSKRNYLVYVCICFKINVFNKWDIIRKQILELKMALAILDFEYMKNGTQ